MPSTSLRPALCALPLLITAALLLAGGGCAMTLSPPAHRANQYSTHFAAYPDEVQTRLRVATIAIGDDRTAVYIALGKPQATRVGYNRDKATGKAIAIELWDYSGYPIDGIDGRFDHGCRKDDIHPELGQEIDDIFGPPI